MTKTMGLLISLGLFSPVALAQGKPDALEACYQQPDGAPRLACFNREMQRRQSAAISASPKTADAGGMAVTPAAPTAAVQHPADDTVGLQGSALRHKLKDEGVQPEAAQSIVAKVVRMVPRPHSLQAFVLDNGQAWEQAESMDNLDVKPDDTVIIKPGILGAFFLNTPRRQRVRVHRIL